MNVTPEAALTIAITCLTSEEKRLRVSAQTWESVVRDGRYLHEYANSRGAHKRHAATVAAIRRLEEMKHNEKQGVLL